MRFNLLGVLLCSLLPTVLCFPPSRANGISSSTSKQASFNGRIVQRHDLRGHPTKSLQQVGSRPFPLSMAGTDVAGGGQEKQESTGLKKISQFLQKNFFVCGMFVAVTMARLFPTLGKNGSLLRPELVIGKFGVTLIFLVSGLSLKLSELTEAFSNWKLNVLIQSLIFGAWPLCVGYPLVHILTKYATNLLPLPLVEGLFVLTCLPTTVNMCILLTSSAGGNVACALCNAVISNLMGIFATPAILMKFFGNSNAIQLPFGEMVLKLCNKVLLPVAIGQGLRATPVKEFYTKNSKAIKRAQELILLGIVWNAFCNAFYKGLGISIQHGLFLFGLLSVLHVGALFGLIPFFSLFNYSRPQAVAGAFCASQKTLAFGLPLVNTIFEGNPNMAAYCAPIMFIHPLELLLGSLFVPKISKYVEEGDKKAQ